MNKDHYKTLGVPRNATLVDIKRARRQQARKYHPDCGGPEASDDKMKEVNLAFEILSDPDLRRNYDFAETHPENLVAQKQAAAENAQAYRHAQNYPREWSAFEKWMADDFRNTKYGKEPGLPMPTADGLTGWVFILAGGGIGCLLSGVIHSPYPVVAFACIAGGAWIAKWLHQAISAGLASSGDSRPTPTPEPQPIVIKCPRCAQSLRVPSLSSALRITCSKCRHVFKHASH